jgi:predicted methyltransferase
MEKSLKGKTALVTGASRGDMPTDNTTHAIGSSAIRSEQNGEDAMSTEKKVQTVKNFFAAIGRGDKEGLGDRSGVDGERAVDRRPARRVFVECPTITEIPMYNQSKLSELIQFARVDAGSIVIDVYPGDGDWTRLFSDIVGLQGRVYSFVPAEIARVKNDSVDRMRRLAKEPGRENVEVVSADLVAMPEATQPADVLWLHLFYHDLHTALIQARGATAAHFNRAVYERLKPGGSYVIVDHAAAVGAGTSDAQSLHRIEPASVREEVEAAGFVLDAESTILANKDDSHSIKVFDPSIKGETDRFAYRFVKP